MDLPTYDNAKFAIADILRMADAIVRNGDGGGDDLFRDLFEALSEDRFNLVLIGRFNRGKSSLMNAILGVDRLPTGIVPLTSVITTVSYGSSEDVVLRYHGRRLDRTITLAELADHVTERGNPGNAEDIRQADIHLPAEILRRGVYFVDTPGLGSAIAENTQTTEGFLPQADAILLVTGHESPLSVEEEQVLRRVADCGTQTIVVVNKLDLVSPQERQDVLDFLGKRLVQLFGERMPSVFSVSARDALNAKQAADKERVEASGIGALERYLVAFLLGARSPDFLASMCVRVRERLHEVDHTRQMDTLVERIDSLSESLRGGRAEPAAGLFQPVSPDLSNLHRVAGCEICAAASNAVWDRLRHYQYELVADEAARDDFAHRSGLCAFHIWAYERIASPYGVAMALPPLFDRLAGEMRRATREGTDGDAPAAILRGRLPQAAHCILCEVQAEAESNAVEATRRHLKADGDRAIETLSALCLPHFVQLLGAFDDGDLVRRVGERQAVLFERMARDLRRYALKRSAVRRQTQTREEATAAQRALRLLAGHPTVNNQIGKTP